QHAQRVAVWLPYESLAQSGMLPFRQVARFPSTQILAQDERTLQGESMSARRQVRCRRLSFRLRCSSNLPRMDRGLCKLRILPEKANVIYSAPRKLCWFYHDRNSLNPQGVVADIDGKGIGRLNQDFLFKFFKPQFDVESKRPVKIRNQAQYE